MPNFDITDHGAIGDGATDDAASIQSAIDACAAAGGGRVVVPAGRTFLTGTIRLRSHVELHLEAGSVLAASGDDAAYTERRATTGLSFDWPENDPDHSIMLVLAENCTNVSITGTGTIDGGGRHFVISDLGAAYEMKHARPYTVFFIGCDDVVMRDVTVRDGAYWTLRASGCRGVLIHGVTIRNDWKLPNSDAIDIDTCQNVRISDCDITAGDDGICIKTCRESVRFGETRDVVVVGCTITSTSSAICIGSEMASPISNCIFSSCVISSTNRGLAIQLAEGSPVSNVLFTDMVIETRFFDEIWWGRGEPIHISGYPWREASGRLRNVRFRNILARSENGVVVRAEDAGTISGVQFDSVRIEIDRWSGLPGGFWDLRPHPSGGFIEHGASGFHLEQVSDVRLRDCEVVWVQPADQRSDDLGPAITAIDVDGLALTDFRGEAADPARHDAIQVTGGTRHVLR